MIQCVEGLFRSRKTETTDRIYKIHFLKSKHRGFLSSSAQCVTILVRIGGAPGAVDLSSFLSLCSIKCRGIPLNRNRLVHELYAGSGSR